MFSRSCEYALQSILYIALHSEDGKAIGLKRISESQNIPIHFLSKILQQLVKGKILSSIKGPNGGFILSTHPSKLRLIRVVKIIDGLDIFERCGIGLKQCSDKNPCPIHFEMEVVKDKIRLFLTEKTLAELCEDVGNGMSIVSYK